MLFLQFVPKETYTYEPIQIEYSTPIIVEDTFPGEIVYHIPVDTAATRQYPLIQFETKIVFSDFETHINNEKPARIRKSLNEHIMSWGAMYNGSRWFLNDNPICGIYPYIIHDDFCTKTIEVDYVSSVAYVNNKFAWIFGHVVGDVSPMYSVVPKYIIDRTYPLLPLKAKNTVFDYIFSVLGYTDYVIAESKLIFSREIFTVEPSPCETNPDFMHQTFRRIMATTLELDGSEPIYYFLIQRAHKRRHLDNFDEILSTVRLKLPHIQWAQRPIVPFVEDIRQYNRAKLAFGLHGADFANAIFMQPGTAICEVQCSRFNPMYIDSCLATQKIVVAGRNTSIVHDYPAPNTLKPSYVVSILKSALTLLDEFDRK